MLKDPGYAELTIKNTLSSGDSIGTIYNDNGNNPLHINGQTPRVELISQSFKESGYQGFLYKNLDT